MEASEAFAGVMALVIGGLAWGRWFVRVHAVDPLVGRPGRTWVGLAALASYLLINFVVLRTLSASDVRDSPIYIGFYLILAFGVSAFALFGLRIFGIRPADIAQVGNRAAGAFVVLAMAGAGFAFAGANIGDGPGFHVVLFCTLLSYSTMLVLLIAHVAMGRSAYRILVEQDLGAALRTGGMVIACGICLGRAVAGDWTGTEAAFVDFSRRCWPAFAFCAMDILVTRALRGRDSSTSTFKGAVVGAAYVGLAVIDVMYVGIPS